MDEKLKVFISTCDELVRSGHDACAIVCASPNLSVARPAMVGSSGEAQPRRAFETNQD